MAVKFTNNAKTTLASGITSTATSATVVDGSVFPTLGAGEYFYCTFDDTTNNEIVKVTARSGNTLTIVRGVDNTTARAFSSGDAAELRATAGLLTDIQENIAAKSANQTVYNTTTASSATSYDIGIDPSVEANAMVFLNGVMQHHDTFSFSGSTLTFDTAPSDGMALEVIVDNLINLQSSNLTVDTFTAADVGGNPQTDFTLSDSPAAETNLIVFVDGVFQAQDSYTISTNVLTMTDGVIADRVVTVYVINPVNIGTPSDGTVTSAKLSGNITMPANLTVTGDVAFDSPTFVVDNANSRVGIGTASPSTLLDIVGDVKMSANLTVDTSTLVVDSTNNRVGIGTASPDTNLHIGSGTTGENLGVKLNRGSTTNFFVANDGTKSAYIGVDAAQGYMKMGSLTDHPVSISQNNGTAIYIDTSKNVGVGITTIEQLASDSVYPRIQSYSSATSGHFCGLMIGRPNSAGLESSIAFTVGGIMVGKIQHDYVAANHNDMSFHLRGASGDPDLEVARYWAGSGAETAYLIGVTDATLSGTDSGFVFKSDGNSSFVTGAGIMYMRRTSSNGTHIKFRSTTNATVGQIDSNGTSTSYVTTSDYRLKENVVYDFDALSRVQQLKPARFNFIENPEVTQDGFLAHEVQDIVPIAVSGIKDAVDEEGNIEPQGVDHSKLVPLLTKAIQEQQTIIEDLKARIETLENN